MKEVVDHPKAIEYLKNIVITEALIDSDVIVNINNIACPSASAPVSHHLTRYVPEHTIYIKLPVHIQGSPAVRPFKST